MGMRRDVLPSDLVISSYESQHLLGNLCEPVPCRWPHGWLALPLPRSYRASAPGSQRGKPGGRWQKQTQIQVGFSMEQCQIRSVAVPQHVNCSAQMWFLFREMKPLCFHSCFRLVVETEVQIWKELSGDHAGPILWAQGSRSGPLASSNDLFRVALKSRRKMWFRLCNRSSGERAFPLLLCVAPVADLQTRFPPTGRQLSDHRQWLGLYPTHRADAAGARPASSRHASRWQLQLQIQ